MYNVAIVGSTGNVGRKFLEILEERNFPIKNLYLFASQRSAGSYLEFKGQKYLVENTCEENIKNKKIESIRKTAKGTFSYLPELKKKIFDHVKKSKHQFKIP